MVIIRPSIHSPAAIGTGLTHRRQVDGRCTARLETAPTVVTIGSRSFTYNKTFWARATGFPISGPTSRSFGFLAWPSTLSATFPKPPFQTIYPTTSLTMAGIFSPKDEPRCTHYAGFMDHLQRWQFDVAYWLLFLFVLHLMFGAAWAYSRFVQGFSPAQEAAPYLSLRPWR